MGSEIDAVEKRMNDTAAVTKAIPKRDFESNISFSFINKILIKSVKYIYIEGEVGSLCMR